ncbi:hypothetical protein AVEN_118501-1 [Araneus ventricosus]|uniref:Uncharacterized protein n=1 Tax=Araneus ventricosus TaxID=182803 RepID=A0A4Y2J150_ARAVE|nr:hypothetical protein AVEN_118501-1 [Araneus ventricosus]
MAWNGIPVSKHIENPSVLVVNISLIVVDLDENRCHRTWDDDDQKGPEEKLSSVKDTLPSPLYFKISPIGRFKAPSLLLDCCDLMVGFRLQIQRIMESRANFTKKFVRGPSLILWSQTSLGWCGMEDCADIAGFEASLVI